MTKFLSLLLVGAALATAFWVTGCSKETNGGGASTPETKTLYTCGMHPQVIQDHPGNCSICGMKLTPIRKAAGNAAAPASGAAGDRKIRFYKSTMIPGEIKPAPGKDSMGMEMVPVYEEEGADAAVIMIDPVTTQNMGLRTALVEQGPVRRVIRTVAAIDFDETSLADVTTKFRGWIEKLHVDATGRQVHRGETLFEIYSPDLYSAQAEYLVALSQSGKADAAGDSIRSSAVTKLKFFDISDEQIAELARTRVATKTLKVTAPRDGIVVEKMAVEGQMVDAGMRLYRLADLSLVWVQAQIYEQDLPFIKLGQEALVKLSYFPDREFRGRVTYIYPTVDEKTRTARVRMEFHNPGFFLKPGMYATAEMRVELAASAVLVPDSAVLRSGEHNTVFVALDAGRFEPRVVALGPRSENNQYQVYHGLQAGERVVTSGQFMLDSESQLREAIAKMQSPGAKPSNIAAGPATETTHNHDTGGTNAVTAEGAATAYICPMPEHVAIKYNHAGKCPICGMTLVPVSQATLNRLQPGGKVLFYTCPMPEHSDVHSAEPGKCPKCSMTLIPVMEPPPPALNGNAALPVPLYTCPMEAHADVVTEQPGKCPKCEMKLVVTSTVDHGKLAEANWAKQHPAGPPPPAAPPATPAAQSHPAQTH